MSSNRQPTQEEVDDLCRRIYGQAYAPARVKEIPPIGDLLVTMALVPILGILIILAMVFTVF